MQQTMSQAFLNFLNSQSAAQTQGGKMGRSPGEEINEIQLFFL